MNTEILNKFAGNRVTLTCCDIARDGIMIRLRGECYRVRNAYGHTDFKSENANSIIIIADRICINITQIGE